MVNSKNPVSNIEWYPFSVSPPYVQSTVFSEQVPWQHLPHCKRIWYVNVSKTWISFDITHSIFES